MNRARLHDEQIVDAILAFATEFDRIIAVRSGDGEFATMDSLGEGDHVIAVCAVGAGLLYRGLAPSPASAPRAFARAYGVSETYAIGVSDGFEHCRGITTGRSKFVRADDYARGWAVGSAIASALEVDE